MPDTRKDYSPDRNPSSSFFDIEVDRQGENPRWVMDIKADYGRYLGRMRISESGVSIEYEDFHAGR